MLLLTPRYYEKNSVTLLLYYINFFWHPPKYRNFFSTRRSTSSGWRHKKNDPLTLNLLAKVEIPILKFKKDHISIYPSAEYANLVGGNFQRYSFGAAYAVKKIYGKFGATAFFDVGNIYRQKRSFFSLSATGELNYRLNDWLKIIGTQQLTQRNDLKILYNSKKEFLISGFFGLKFSF